MKALSVLFSIFFLISCATKRQQEQIVLKKLKRGMSQKEVAKQMGMIPLEKEWEDGKYVYKHYSSFSLLFEEGRLQHWIYTNGHAAAVKTDILSLDRKPAKKLKAILLADPKAPRAEFYLAENYKLLVKALQSSNIEVIDGEGYDLKVVYSPRIYEPDVEYKTVTKAKYDLDYVPGKTTTYNYSGNSYGNFNINSSYTGNTYYGSTSTYSSGSMTKSTPGYLTTRYAGQESNTYEVKRYKKELKLIALDREDKVFFEASFSSYDRNEDLRLYQGLLIFSAASNNLRINDSGTRAIALDNTFFSEFMGQSVPVLREQSPKRNIANQKASSPIEVEEGNSRESND